MEKVFDDVMLTKETIKLSAEKIMSGFDPIQSYLLAKEFEEISKEIMARAKEEAIEILASSDEKRINHNGCWLMAKNLSATYDYSNNPEWVELNFKIKQLEADRKKIEALMIEATRYGELKDTEGKKIIPATITKEPSLTIQVTIPKE